MERVERGGAPPLGRAFWGLFRKTERRSLSDLSPSLHTGRARHVRTPGARGVQAVSWGRGEGMFGRPERHGAARRGEGHSTASARAERHEDAGLFPSSHPTRSPARVGKATERCRCLSWACVGREAGSGWGCGAGGGAKGARQQLSRRSRPGAPPLAHPAHPLQRSREGSAQPAPRRMPTPEQATRLTSHYVLCISLSPLPQLLRCQGRLEEAGRPGSRRPGVGRRLGDQERPGLHGLGLARGRRRRR